MRKKQPLRPMLTVQMDEDDKELLRQAAKLEGHLEMASWVRRVLLQKARQVIKKFNKRSGDSNADV